MRLEYILMGKNRKSPLNDISQVKNILTACFGDIGDSTFTVIHKRTAFELEYKAVKHGVSRGKDSVIHLTLSLTNSKKLRSVEVLETIHNTFMRCKETRSYHAILSYDDISAYYCNRAYPLFHEFERQIRNLVFKLLTKTFGALWLDETIGEDLKSALKERIRDKDRSIRDEKLVEMALYEMDMSQLEHFLFDETRDIDPSQLLDAQLSKESLADMDKEQIVAILESGRPKSIWNRYFAPKIKIPGLKEKLGLIRSNRNKVAHCKPFYKADYDATRRLLYDDGLIEQIEKAIDEVSAEKIDALTIRDVIGGFATMLHVTASAASYVSRAMSPALLKFAEYSAAIRDLIDFKGAGAMLQALARPEFQSALSVQPLQSAMSEVLFQQQELFQNSAMTAAIQAQNQLQESIRPLEPHLSAIENLAIFQSPALQSAMQLQEHLSGPIGMGISYFSDDDEDTKEEVSTKNGDEENDNEQ